MQLVLFFCPFSCLCAKLNDKDCHLGFQNFSAQSMSKNRKLFHHIMCEKLGESIRNMTRRPVFPYYSATWVNHTIKYMALSLYVSLVEENIGCLLYQIEPNNTLIRSLCQIDDSKVALQGIEKISKHIWFSINKNKYKISKTAITQNWLGWHISIQCPSDSRGLGASNDVWHMAWELHLTLWLHISTVSGQNAEFWIYYP